MLSYHASEEIQMYKHPTHRIKVPKVGGQLVVPLGSGIFEPKELIHMYAILRIYRAVSL